MNKTTLVIGASLRQSRYSNICVKTLAAAQIPVKAIGLREGSIEGTAVETGFPEVENIHTVTLYLGPANQHSFYDYILKLNPERVIFNPGTENLEFEDMLIQAGIKVTYDCTIMMVEGGRF